MRGFGGRNRSGRENLDHRVVALVVVGGLSALVAACGEEAQPGLGAGVNVPTTVATTTSTIATTTTASTVDFSQPIFQSTAPLASDIDPTDVAALVADIRGQTADVTEQVRRIAPFLDLSVAPVAQITGIDVTLAPEDDDELHPVEVLVRFRTPETAPELVTTIENQFSGLAWFLNEQTTAEGPNGPVTNSVFRFPGISPDETEFRSSVVGEPAATTAEFEYHVLAAQDDVADEEGVTYFERLSSWQDGLELTRVATLTDVGVETDENSGRVVARYTITADDEAEAIESLLEAVARSDYELLGGADQAPTTTPLQLIDGSGTIITIDVLLSTIEGSYGVEASHGFDLTPLD
jgi:hypothetical protein